MTNPVEQRNPLDPGDATLRNYRYQMGYGVILLAAAATEKNDYRAIWCEQQDDFLCELPSGTEFDACQVKTQQPESGYWQTNDGDFVKSVKRFVAMDTKFPGKIRRFVIVSNTAFKDSDAETQAAKSPMHLLREVRKVTTLDDLAENARKGFDLLREATDTQDGELLTVLKRLDLVIGPSRDGFVAEIAQNHLSQLDDCRSLNAAQLQEVTTSTIDLVLRASSLSCQSPDRHYACLNRDAHNDPQLRAKRLSIEGFLLHCRDAACPHFKYLPQLTSGPLNVDAKHLLLFNAKLDRGGLADHAEPLRRQTLSAHATLLELADRDEHGAEVVTQIEGVVLAECKEAQLRQSQQGTAYGQKMLIDVQDRLKKIAGTEPSRVHAQPYEVLMGMAGLLTEECTVWWSDKFEVDKS